MKSIAVLSLACLAYGQENMIPKRPITLTDCQQDIALTGNALSAVAVTTADVIRECGVEGWAVCAKDILAIVSYLGMVQHDIARGMNTCYQYEGINFDAACVSGLGDATDRGGSAMAVIFDAITKCDSS